MVTFVELCAEAAAQTTQDHYLRDLTSGVAREFALARTALEDAQMRFTRGLAKHNGVFSPADLQKADK